MKQDDSMALITGAGARLLTVFAMLFAGFAGATEPVADGSPWYSEDQAGNTEIHLYFAWSTTCPHCAAAKPFIEKLDAEYPWLIVHSLPLDVGSNEDVELALALAESLGEPLRSVPAFLYCEKMTTGYLSDDTTGAQLRDDLLHCRERQQTTEAEVLVPVLGTVDPETVSLPTFTIVIASLDAFNPCAFFVLLFLLSLLVHARSRGRMALVGGTFVIVSGLVYFAFMVAWLNIFLLFGAIPAITLVAGLLAIVIASFSIKDYFWPDFGVSLSISEEAKPRLFGRMRTLTQTAGLPLMLAGTLTLALAANSYELLCTAGFPMVFTRVLTLNDLPTVTYYLYLVLYNLVYVTPLLVIVTVFVWTLGSRKLSQRTGRFLRLLSGLMMLGLGLTLVIAPGLLESVLTAPMLLVGALATTGVVALADRRGARSAPGASSPGSTAPPPTAS